MLKAEKENLVQEKQRNAALIQDAKNATETLRERESVLESEQASACAELEALREKSTRMASRLEQEQHAVAEVRAAMGDLRAQLESEEEAKQSTVEQMEAIQAERRQKEELLEQKETELRALRVSYEELEDDMYTPVMVLLHKVQGEHTRVMQALEELQQAHFSGDVGISKGLGPAYPMKGLGELDVPRMIEEWGMEVGGEDGEDGEDQESVCPYVLQEDLLSTSLGFKVDSSHDPPQYSIDDTNPKVMKLRERYPEHSEEILEHMRQVHGQYMGATSAGTIVRVPWHEAGDRQLTPAEVVEAFSSHLDKIDKRLAVLLAN